MNSAPKSSLPDVRNSVEQELAEFLAQESAHLCAISPDLSIVCESLTSFLLDSGKRLRPLFAYAGFIAANGNLEKSEVRAMASLELLQACALIHDDLMDASDTRRGKPSIHRLFETLHKENQLEGFATQYGLSAAVLLGDLALVLSDQMLNTSGITAQQISFVNPYYNEMRVELMAGQFLDIYEQTQKSSSTQRSMKIARFKSGKYTIERPLHLGAAMTGSENKALFKSLSNYGLPLGEAFQLRDDLLGVFGDPSVTGKPAGDDLREGKKTVLIALSRENQSLTQQKIWQKFFGKANLDSEGVAALQQIILETSAKTKLEEMIKQLTDQSLAAIKSPEISESGKELMNELVSIATNRSM